MPDEERKILLRSKEACLLLGVSQQTLDHIVRRGEIPVVRIDRLRRFRRETLEAWLRSHEGPWERKGADA